MLDDFSRYIIAWKLCTGMTVEDVTATLDLHSRLQVSLRERTTAQTPIGLIGENALCEGRFPDEDYRRAQRTLASTFLLPA